MKAVEMGDIISFKDPRVEWIGHSLEDELKPGQWAEFSIEGILQDGTERDVFGSAQANPFDPDFDEVEILEIGES